MRPAQDGEVSPVRTLAGIIAIAFGVVLPMATLVWLNSRLRRPLYTEAPSLQPRQVGLILALNGIVPVTFIALGLGMLSARVWNTLTFKVLLAVFALSSVALAAALWWVGATAGRAPKDTAR
jgi:H+/Cl- antiporter ClcA